MAKVDLYPNGYCNSIQAHFSGAAAAYTNYTVSFALKDSSTSTTQTLSNKINQNGECYITFPNVVPSHSYTVTATLSTAQNTYNWTSNSSSPTALSYTTLSYENLTSSGVDIYISGANFYSGSSNVFGYYGVSSYSTVSLKSYESTSASYSFSGNEGTTYKCGFVIKDLLSTATGQPSAMISVTFPESGPSISPTLNASFDKLDLTVYFSNVSTNSKASYKSKFSVYKSNGDFVCNSGEISGTSHQFTEIGFVPKTTYSITGYLYYYWNNNYQQLFQKTTNITAPTPSYSANTAKTVKMDNSLNISLNSYTYTKITISGCTSDTYFFISCPYSASLNYYYKTSSITSNTDGSCNGTSFTPSYKVINGTGYYGIMVKPTSSSFYMQVSASASNSITIYPFKLSAFKITANASDSTGIASLTSSHSSAAPGTTITLNCTLQEGYTFNYYYSEMGTLGTTQTCTFVMPYADVTIYCSTTQKTSYKVTIKNNTNFSKTSITYNGTTSSTTSTSGTSINVYGGDSVYLDCTPSSGYVFSYWLVNNINSGGGQNTKYPITAATTFQPVAKQKTSFAWDSGHEPKQGEPWKITASEWKRLINTVYASAGKNGGIDTSMISGTKVLAAHYDQIWHIIKGTTYNPNSPTPKKPGDKITAADLDTLVSEANKL